MQNLYPCSQSGLAALDSLIASFHESFAAAASLTAWPGIWLSDQKIC